MAPKKDSKPSVPIQPVPEKRGYEFFGPYVMLLLSPPASNSVTDRCSYGGFAIIFGLPVLLFAFTFLCNDVSGCPAPSLLHPSTLTLDNLKQEVGWPEGGIPALYDTEVLLWVLGYYVLQLVLYVVLPGPVVEGTELACGGRLWYKFNGTTLFSWRLTAYSDVK